MIYSRAVILGADGQLGFDLARAFGRAAIGLTHRDIELADKENVCAAIVARRPDIVINAAAIVKTEWCETNRNACMAVNAQGAAHAARAARDAGAPIVHISTDYVLDGEQPGGYIESDVPCPINAYGASKAEGETLVRAANPNHYIVRTSWLFGVNTGHKGYDFPRMMLAAAREQKEVRVVDDQFGSPTYARDLAIKIKELAEAEAPFGTYHLTNQGQCSWHAFAKKIFEIASVQANLMPISTAERASPAARPKHATLLDTKLESLGLSPLPPWERALEAYFKELGYARTA